MPDCKMNAKVADEARTALIAALCEAMRTLALRIQPKVYAHGFLKP